MDVKRLIEILADGYQVENIDQIIQNCEEAFKAPMAYATKNDLLWLIETDDDPILNKLLPLELIDIAIVGDKIDEFHEQVAVFLEDLPDFPYEENFTAKEYFEWLEKELGDNELLFIGDSMSDDLQGFLVYKEYSDEIFQLTNKLNIQCHKPSEYLY